VNLFCKLINAHTVNVQYLPNGKVYEVQTWYTDGTRRPASAVSTVTSKIKGQGRKAITWCVWQVLAVKSRTKRPRNNKIGRKVVHPTGNNAHQLQGQRSKVKVTSATQFLDRKCVICAKRKGRLSLTSNLVQRRRMKTRITDKRRDLQGQRSRSQVITDATSNNVHQFQGQKVKGQARLLLRLKMYHIYRTRRLRNFKTGRPIRQSNTHYQLPRPAIKAYEVGFFWYRVGRTQRPRS